MTCIYEYIPTNKMVLRIYRLSPIIVSPFSPTYSFIERSIGSISQNEGPSLGRTKTGDDEGMSTIFSSSYRALEWYFIGSLPPLKPLLPSPPPLSRRCDLISLHPPLSRHPPVLSHLHLTKVHNIVRFYYSQLNIYLS
jgi:hypothetical protein